MFELWNQATGNALGEFATMAEALAAVRVSAETHGSKYVADWALAVADDEDLEPIAAGAMLLTLARGSEERAVPA